jgi:hypothetical protein
LAHSLLDVITAPPANSIAHRKGSIPSFALAPVLSAGLGAEVVDRPVDPTHAPESLAAGADALIPPQVESLAAALKSLPTSGVAFAQQPLDRDHVARRRATARVAWGASSLSVILPNRALFDRCGAPDG